MKLRLIYESLWNDVEKNKNLKNNPQTLKILSEIDKIPLHDYEDAREQAKSWNRDLDNDMIMRETYNILLTSILKKVNYRGKINLDSSLGQIIMSKFDSKFDNE